MAAKLLFLGDVHLGRRPVTIPVGADPARLGPERALERAVARALEERVAAFVFAGDVVESLEDRFEAERRLRPELERLIAAGIPVFAVAGNHDVLALPRLAARLPGFEILGRGGWESRVIAHEGRALCRLHGWSFTEPICKTSPLLSLAADQIDSDLPNLGLLHCDRDAADRRYAPVRSAEFETGAAARMDAWFLGHVHRPDHEGLAAARPVGYLGSLVGLDPGEPGRHGPWLVDFPAGGRIRTRQIPLGPLRYEGLTLDLDGLDVEGRADLEDELRDRVHAAFAGLARELDDELDAVEACGVRFRLGGRAARPAAVLDAARRLVARGEALVREIEGTTFFCEKVLADLRPLVALDELARGRGPMAGLARFVLALDRGEAVLPPGLAAGIEELLARPVYGELDELADPLAPGRLKEAALELLAAMERQKEIGP